MLKTDTKLSLAALAVGVILIGLYLLASPGPAKANVTDHGVLSRVASDQAVVVGPQQVLTVAAASNACASRIISTGSTTLMLSFSSTFTPNGSTGHIQAASTTVAYDNLTYGCGAITAYATASSTVAVAVLNQ